jgi:hypothetical protein
MLSETHTPQRDMLIRDILWRMRHDGCGGRAGRVELLTGIEGASSRPGAEDRAAGLTLTIRGSGRSTQAM